MKRLFFILSLIYFNTQFLRAQTIDAEPEVSNICSGGSVNLTATITPPGAPTAPGSLPTNSYAVSSIPFAPGPLTGGITSSATDDSQVGPFPIGFSFCFFGTSYTNFYIGSNGWIAFTPQGASATTYTAATIPSTVAAVPKNCIMGPWQDWHPGFGTGPYINHQTLGTAPFRRLVVTWNNIPMYQCTGNRGTFQIIIYETWNTIENFIVSKPNCLSWPTANPGLATQGVHNAAGTVAFTVPGRNNTQWTASNEGWRYTPNGSATYTINWYEFPSNALVGTGANVTLSPVASPQYYYAKVDGPNGCGVATGGNNTDTVVVNSINIPVDAGPYTKICQGSSTMLGASGGTIYSWSPATGLNNPAIANPIASPSSTTVYTVMVTDASGCVGFDTVSVGVEFAPVVDAGFPSGICSGDNIMLGGNGPVGTYSWSPAATLDDSTILTPVATPVVTTTYTLTITNSVGCSSSDTVSVIILNPGADAGPDTAICQGSSIMLGASGGDSYLWSPATDLSNPSIANPVASPTGNMVYYVTVSNSSTGCSASDSVIITIIPAVVADAGADTSICLGDSIMLSASGGMQYAWVPSAGLSDTSVFNPVAGPLSSVTYTVMVTDALGCSGIDSVFVRVDSLPSVNAGPDLSICIGSGINLNASGADSYMWSPGATLNDSTLSNPVASPGSPTTYVVTGVDTNGCVNTDTVNIGLNGLTITAAGNAVICQGDSTALNVSGALTYYWLPAATLSDDSIANPLAFPSSSTTYTVIGTAGSGCSDTAYVTVGVNSLPAVNSGASLSVCNGSNANLSVSGANTYSWSPAGSLNNPNIPNPVASPGVTTLYTVTGTDLNGCSSQDTVTVVVHNIPAANAGTNTSICMGDSTILNPSGGVTYSWAPAAGLSSTIIQNPFAFPSTTTTYTVTVTGAGFCTATSQVTITVNSVPVVNAGQDVSICSGLSAQLNASGANSYFWSPSAGLNISNIANPSANPSQTTSYIVTGSNLAGCTDSDTVVVTVSNTITVATASVSDETCFDNDGEITIGAVSGGTGPFMYSLNGNAPQSGNTFSSLSQGMYNVIITDALGCATSQTVNVGQISNVNASFTATPPSGPKPLTVSFTNTSTGAINYTWDFGNGAVSTLTDPSAIYAANGTYTVLLYATNGGFPCVDSAVFTIEVFEEMTYSIPNVFTPNSDNKNDFFGIQSIGVTGVDGAIFNRWGKKIYEWSGDAASGWDGSSDSGKAEDGTYFYILKIKGADGSETEEKGHVQVLGS
ncbi:MAG TPA: gliding motility-associated C-terminal domain-containing protein [Bacteroidia bacterium]